jgi:hypothetical protein
LSSSPPRTASTMPTLLLLLIIHPSHLMDHNHGS